MSDMMMNQQMTGMPQQGQPQQPQMPQMPPQAGAGQPPMPQLRGEDVQMLLFSRVQQLSEPEMIVLDQMVTPENIVVLLKLFPELAILFERASAFQGEQYQGQQQMAEDSEDDYEGEGGNPLVNNNLSRGLMG